VLRAGRGPPGPGALRRHRADPGGRGPGRRRPCAQAAVHRAELPQPDRPHATSRAAAAIAALAGERGLWLVEDDPYGELRYAGKPIAPLAGLPGAEDRTLALGTLSKIAAPGLRIGWVRAPAALRGELVVAKQAADLHTSTIDQAAARLWLESCDLDARVVALREAYRPRRDALLDGLALALPPGARWTRPEGGMFVWARLPGGRDATALLGRALAHDVAFVPGRPFFAGPADRATLRLSFTAHAPGEIAEGLRRLGRVGAAAQASSS